MKDRCIILEVCKMYLCGGMSDLSFDEQNKWRKQLRYTIKNDYEYEKNVEFFDPTQYYNFEYKLHKTEKEIMDFDLYNLRNSDIVVVNFNSPNSIGSAMEIMLAYELHKPIIGVNIENKAIHPWLKSCCTRVCDSMEELYKYLTDFFLN